MGLNPVELIAAIFAVVILVKFVVLLFAGKKSVLKFAKKVSKYNSLLVIVSVILILVLCKYLLAQLNIAQIFVAAMLGMSVFVLILVQYPKVYMALVEDYVKKPKQAWLPWLIFLGASIWVLVFLFV